MGELYHQEVRDMGYSLIIPISNLLMTAPGGFSQFPGIQAKTPGCWQLEVRLGTVVFEGIGKTLIAPVTPFILTPRYTLGEFMFLICST